jgi:hypothetical protein
MSSEIVNQPPKTSPLSIVQALNALPRDVLDSHRWVACSGKNPAIGGGAWYDHASSLHAAAMRAVELGGDGVGLSMGGDTPFTVIDFDGVQCEGHTHSVARALLDELATAGAYIEWSQSGAGFHAIVQRHDSLPDGNSRPLGACAVCGRDHYDKRGKSAPVAVEWWSGSANRFVHITGKTVTTNHGVVPPMPLRVEQMLRPLALGRATSTGAKIKSPTPPSEARDELEILDWRYAALRVCSAKIFEALNHGDFSPWQDDGSNAVFAIAQALMGRGGLSPVQCLDVLCECEFTHEVGERRRGSSGARDWLWLYCVEPATVAVRTESANELFTADVAPVTPVWVEPVFDFRGTPDVAPPIFTDPPRRTVAAVQDLFNSGGDVVDFVTGTGAELLRPTQASREREAERDFIYIKDEDKYMHTRTLSRRTSRSLYMSLNLPNPSAALRDLKAVGIIKTVSRVGYDISAPPLDVYIDSNTGEDVFNMYRGWRVLPYSGEGAGTDESVRPWLDLVDIMIPDIEQRNYVLDFLAFVLQNPHAKMQQALVLYGEHGGEGKSFTAGILERILVDGEAKPVSSNEFMHPDFNSWHKACRVAIFSEGLRATRNASRDEIAEKLKSVVDCSPSGVYTLIEKNAKPVLERDLCSYIICTNHIENIPFDGTDRKLFTAVCSLDYTVGSSVPQLKEHNNRVYEEFISGWLTNPTQQGIAKITAYLLQRDITLMQATGKVMNAELHEELAGESMGVMAAAATNAVRWAEGNPNVFVLNADQMMRLINHEIRKLGGHVQLNALSAARRWRTVFPKGRCRDMRVTFTAANIELDGKVWSTNVFREMRIPPELVDSLTRQLDWTDRELAAYLSGFTTVQTPSFA